MFILMNPKILLALASFSICFSLYAGIPQQHQLFPASRVNQYCPLPELIPIHIVKEVLNKESGALHKAVINKVLTILNCANLYNLQRNNILTVIDYSMPANEKRLWIFDLEQQKLLFHTYVSHGIKSGALSSTLFSNKYDSKSSSIGLYKTEKTYFGRDGLSLRLEGLDNGFNNNAFNRSIVMHGGWYVDEQFISKYGRAGRSWGCPAVPLNLAVPIINTIKNNSLLIVYYPSDDWFVKSKFLKCGKPTLLAQKNTTNPLNTNSHVSNSTEVISATSVQNRTTLIAPLDATKRDDVLLTEIHKNSTREENTAIVVMPANSYEQTFQVKAPLDRMLRRQINNNEYIALSTVELQKVNALNEIYFARPVITMVRGNYVTQMQLINLGKIKDIRFNGSNGFTFSFEAKNSINVKSTDRFIRWLGL